MKKFLEEKKLRPYSVRYKGAKKWKTIYARSKKEAVLKHALKKYRR